MDVAAMVTFTVVAEAFAEMPLGRTSSLPGLTGTFGAWVAVSTACSPILTFASESR